MRLFGTLSVFTLSPTDSVLPARASLVLGRAEEKVWGLWGWNPAVMIDGSDEY